MSEPPFLDVYTRLLARFGPQHWWPGDGPDEMIIGAILVQNTAWTHASKAIDQLKLHSAIDWPVLYATEVQVLAEWIRPAGYYNSKAKKLKAFATCVVETYAGQLNRLFDAPDEVLRNRLLAIWGIGPETADCIMLYAAERPVFVIDTYTRRLLTRHRWAAENEDYKALSRLFSLQLRGDTGLCNEFHALIVELGKRYCRATPMCDGCPLETFLPKE
ncbi:MAG: endonuclease-3 related protein [Verrucomicrobiales bacterium]|jgi:endonuclease-3 related protein